ncbi:MAG TPA: ATP-binding protein [Gaiellaceae bacterium]
MNRLPIRLRLSLAFTVVMALVLAAMSFFVYDRVGNALLASIDQSLRAQSADVSRLDRGRVDLDSAAGGGVAQIIRPDGRLLSSDPPGLPRLLDAKALSSALAGTRTLRSGQLPGLRERWRVLTEPAMVHGQRAVLVVAKSFEARNETLDHLLDELVFAGPLALVLAGVAGYGLAAAALRPVEVMRSRAKQISASTPGARLPVPPARDEVSRLAETLNEMLARLEAALAHERRFVADASHELRTPLALLKAELDVALRRRRTRDELEHALHSASEETDRLTRLAEDLLLIARSDAGGLPIRRQPVPAAQVLDVVAGRFSGRARDRKRPLEVLPPDGLVLDADPARLEQALGNLVENALEHGRGPVVLSARPRGDLVELHVADSGPGFPREFMASAFDRFSRPDQARSGGGSGLGLSIVDLIAEAHGGETGAENRPTGGADVWIAVGRANS